MLIKTIPYGDALAAGSLFAEDPHCAFLDGAAAPEGSGRYSYLAADPFRIIEAREDGVFVDGRFAGRDFFAVLATQLALFPASLANAPVPFIGGAIGYLGYELGGLLERLPAPRPDRLALPTAVIAFYDVIAAFDHKERNAWIISSGYPATGAERETCARMRANAMAEKIAEASPELSKPDWTACDSWQSGLARPEAESLVARIVSYIQAGDIFQANFTQRFEGKRPKGLDDFGLYRRLRSLSPAPYAAFLRAGSRLSVLSASPERFLRLGVSGEALAQPIKGTRPRASVAAEDAAFAQELVNSPKDRAENLMIVDLMRNDLSRVAVPGSVKVPQLCALESFASVHHLTSTVAAQLTPGMGAVDLLRASFPGGSVTGAPKIRAMEIIHELEPSPRGVYCGCLGWIGFDGAMDMSMTIRTLTVSGDTVIAQAGGGIVADSDPAAEYEECMTKIAPLLRALSGEGQ